MSLCSGFSTCTLQAFLEEASLSSLDPFLFDVWQFPCPVMFLYDILWLTGQERL